MSKQITTRLPDADVDFLDAMVADGMIRDRTDGVHTAVELLRRVLRARNELGTVAAVRSAGESLYPDLDGLAEWGATRPLDFD